MINILQKARFLPGARGLTPVVQVGDKTYEQVAPDDMDSILEEHKQ
jgi:NADH:ubiquinone oxidoreductase subunit E